MFKSLLKFIFVVCAGGVAVSDATAARIKDVADIAGVRSNHLVGYGLVVGLPGTGDQTTQTPFYGAKPEKHASAIRGNDTS